VAHAEKEFGDRAQVKSTLKVMFDHADEEGTGTLSKEQLVHILTDPAAAEVLSDLEIDIQYFNELAQMMYDMTTGESGEMDIPAIVTLILELRGQRAATVQDIINCHDFSRWSLQKEFQRQEATMSQKQEGVMKKLRQDWAPPSIGPELRMELSV